MRQEKKAAVPCGMIRKMGHGKRTALGVLAALLAFLPGSVATSIMVQAASGTVYSCTINRCYAHPVTGEIEDPGGEASYATGQGMVEGTVSSQGILEITDDGAYYLTFRISLVDFTSGHSFSVQNTGDTGWSAVTPAVTANGSDSNGTTSDLCIQVPSEDCVVRGSMYVTPMGRDVVFYFYPNNYTQGNTTDMITSMVTESAGSGTDASQTGTEGESQADTEGIGQAAAEETGQIDTDENGQTATLSSAEEDGQSGTAKAGRSGEEETAPKETKPASQLESSIEQAADPTPETSDTQLDNVQGLSLSTASGTEGDTAKSQDGGGAGMGLAGLIAAITVSMTISGLILMAAAAVLVYYFRKNWRRWGGYDDGGYEEDDE